MAGEQREKTLRWLSPIDFEQDSTAFSKQWVQGTSQWVLQQPEYVKWVGSSQNDEESLKLGWIRGGVGSGKTFLAHFIVGTLAANNCNVLQYFFNAKQEQGPRRTNLCFVRTILHQLLVNTNLDTSSTLEALLSLRTTSGKSEAHSAKNLWNELFRCMQGLIDTPVYLIVDAIDEADRGEREDILESLTKLVSLSPSVRILVTGRPDEDVLEWFEKSSRASNLAKIISEIRFPPTEAARDIETYIDSRIRGSSKLSHPSVAGEIKDAVLERAEGMFLYVRLMLDELGGEASVAAVRRRLGEFPKTLNGYYDSVFSRINNGADSARELARDLLAWITTSYEPMHVNTVLIALKSQAQSRMALIPSLTGDNAEDEFELLDPLKEIRSICFPLLEVTGGGIVQVVHCSVAAYILAQGTNSQANSQGPTTMLTLPQANQEIALACICFLRCSARDSFNRNGTTPNDATPDGSLLFLEYATKYWPEHMSESNQDVLVRMPLLFQAIRFEQKWFLEWVARRSGHDYRFRKTLGLDEGDEGAHPSCLEIAAYFGITSWASSILEGAPQKAPLWPLPNMIAVTRGSLDVLRLFHERSCASGSWNRQDELLLHSAARNGHAPVARYLIAEAGCDVNAVDPFGRSALMHACSHGHSAVVGELLVRGADTSLLSRAGYSAAEDAAAAGDIRSLTALLAKSETSATSKCLLLSSANGHGSVVEFLLRNTPLDPNGTDENSWTPLHWACRNGHIGVVKLLLTGGATVDACDSFQRTPLNRAVRIGSSELVQALLQSGASPVSHDSSGLSLTHLAAAGGFNEVLGLVLAEGVDPNTGAFPRGPFPEATWEHWCDSTPSGPPLHLAAENGHASTVRYLVERGAGVNKEGIHGETALHRACAAGQEAVVPVLLEANADDSLGTTSTKFPFPLVLATKNLHIGIVSILAPRAWSRLDPSPSDGVASYLPAYGSSIRGAVEAAVECDSVQILATLFSHAPQNLQAPAHVGLRIFEKVFRNGNIAIAELLIGLGYDLSRSTVEHQQYPTPLSYAVEGQKLPMVQLLLGRKVSPIDFQPTPNPKFNNMYADSPYFSRNKLTALDMAALVGNLDIIELLEKRQSQPPDPEDPQSTWPCLLDRATLLPRLIYFADIRQKMQAQSGSWRLYSHTSDYGVKPHNPLCNAIANSDLEEVQVQIAKGIDVNQLDWEFETPLIKAVKAGNPDIVARLLDAGADVSVDALDGTSVASMACEALNPRLVKVLLDAGASPKGLTLTKACLRRNLELVKLLLDAGVDPNLTKGTAMDEPPLYHVVGSWDDAFFVKVLPLLLNAGARAFDETYTVETVLHLAADHGRVSLIQKFADMGVPIDACDEKGRTALHRALVSKSPAMREVCEELLRLGASTAQIGKRGISALHMAGGAGILWMVERLVRADSGQRDVETRDAEGRTPLMWAIVGDWANSPQRALLNGTFVASWSKKGLDGRKNVETVRFLLDNGANMDTADHEQRNPLHWAAAVGDGDMMSTLLGRGADVHAVDKNRQTPLHLAVATGAVECVRMLLAAGANPNAIDSAPTEGASKHPLRELELTIDNQPCQSPPMHLAFGELDGRHLHQMTRLLLEAGANVFGRNFNGETCLHVAVKEGNVAAVRELICANSYDNLYIGVKDNLGRTARDRAEQLGHAQIVELLGEAEKGKRGGCRYSRTTVIP